MREMDEIPWEISKGCKAHLCNTLLGRTQDIRDERMETRENQEEELIWQNQKVFWGGSLTA
jgi:hypothetical protein